MQDQNIKNLVDHVQHLRENNVDLDIQYDSIAELRDLLKATQYPMKSWVHYFSNEKQRDEFAHHAIHVFSIKEITRAQDYLSHKDPKPKSAHANNTLIDDEIEILKAQDRISASANICFLGSGAMPTSAIILLEKGYKNVTCVDYDPVAFELGKQVIERSCPDNNVKYVFQNAIDCDYSSFDIVWTANFLSDKGKTLSKIKNDRKGKETVVIIRDTPGLKGIIHLALNENDVPEGYPGNYIATDESTTRVNTSRIYYI